MTHPPFKPRADFLLVKQVVKVEESTILVPEHLQDKQSEIGFYEWEVIAVGEGPIIQGNRWPCTSKVGDRIILPGFPMMSYTFMKDLGYKGYAFVRDSETLATVDIIAEAESPN